MDRLTQFVSKPFSESRSSNHDETSTSSPPLPSSSSSGRSMILTPRSLPMTLPPRKDVFYFVDRSTAGLNAHAEDVDVEGASTGSRTPDDTRVTGEDNNFRSQWSAFTSSTYERASIRVLFRNSKVKELLKAVYICRSCRRNNKKLSYCWETVRSGVTRVSCARGQTNEVRPPPAGPPTSSVLWILRSCDESSHDLSIHRRRSTENIEEARPF